MSLLRQAERHRLKIQTEPGRKDTTHEYWKKEILGFERRAKERTRLLNKLKRRK